MRRDDRLAVPKRITLTNKIYLRAIDTLIKANGGVSPTCAEIGAHLNVTAQGAESHVARLKAAGLVTNSRQHRSMRLTQAGLEALAGTPGIADGVTP